MGSIVASTLLTATSTVGMVIERMAYEPFGKRRFISGQFDQAGTIDATSTTRGFTGHEHLDSLDFIHMNARVYDPDIGRFLSPDPKVTHSHNPQGFNRYAYAYNNPLNATDPTGFSNNPNSGTNDVMAALDGALRGNDKGSEGNLNEAEKSLGTNNPGVKGQPTGSPSAPGTKPGDETVAQAQILADPARVVRGAVAGAKAAHTAAAAVAAGILAAQEKSRDAIAKGFEAVKNGINSLTTNQAEVDAKDNKDPKSDAAGKGTAAVAGGSTPPGENDNKTPTDKGLGRAPQEGKPDSIYEQVDEKGNVKSRTFYDGNGRSFSRQDFDHFHGGMKPHEHQRDFDAGGRPKTAETVTSPKGY